MIKFDFHSHILPAIDDGAKNITQSLGMLEILENSGVECVVLSPHCYLGRTDMDKLLLERVKSYSSLCDAYKGKMQFKLASEVGVSFKYNKFSKLKSLAIENTRYILLELPFVKDWSPLGEWLFDLMEETGLIPIIAHVEYFDNILKKPQIIADLVDMGCKIQVNATSFLDEGLKPFVTKLLQNGLVHCIGSDSHNLEHRPPKIAEACEVIKSEMGEEYISKINESSAKILQDRKFKSPYKKAVKRIFNRYI